jgi:hypothetical protein
VLVAAVVGFAGSPFGHGVGSAFGHGGGAELLGPVAVAFLCGPLDLAHWRRRAFWRMAYNSGNRMIAALLGVTVFDAVQDGRLRLDARFALAALGTSLVFALVDLVIFVGFEQVRGEQSVRAAVRKDLVIDCLTVPLGLFGAMAGYLAVEAGWWLGVIVLVPAVFVPELVLVRGRRAFRTRGFLARLLHSSVPTVLSAGAVLCVVVALAPLPANSVLVGVAVVAFVAGYELRVETRAPVPGSGLAAVVVAAMVVGRHAAPAAAAVVAATAMATAWVLVRRNGWWVPIVTAAAALTSAAVFDAHPSRAGALVAALVFELVLVTRLPRIFWTAPLVCAAVALAYAWREMGTGVVVVFGAGLVAVAAAAAVWGVPPWESRVLAPWGARHPTRAHRIMVLSTAALSFGLGVAAVTTGSSDRRLLVFGASGAAAAVTTMAMVGVRQWRFAPRGRARDAAFVVASALLVVVVYPAAALGGNAWSVAILAAGLIVPTVIAWPLARLASAGAVAERSAGSVVVNR